MTEDEHEDIKKKTFKNIYKDNEDIFEEVMEEFVTNRKTILVDLRKFFGNSIVLPNMEDALVERKK